MPDCPHPSSLIYFDRYNAILESWEVCDLCHEKFNVVTHYNATSQHVDEWSNVYYERRT